MEPTLKNLPEAINSPPATETRWAGRALAALALAGSLAGLATTAAANADPLPAAYVGATANFEHGFGSSAAGSDNTGAVEVFRLHPDERAAEAPEVTFKVDTTGFGDGGAVELVEDRHLLPYEPLDSGGIYAFAYAELANNHRYPVIYDNQQGIVFPDCPIKGCASLNGSPLPNQLPAFTFDKATNSNGQALPYPWGDFILATENGHSIVGLPPGWTETPDTHATMKVIRSQDMSSAGVRVANYDAEQMSGTAEVKTSGSADSWSIGFAEAPCSNTITGVPVSQVKAKFSGMTIPDGESSVEVSCDNNYDYAMAIRPTDWRLATESGGQPTDTNLTATQSLNRLVVLSVDDGSGKPNAEPTTVPSQPKVKPPQPTSQAARPQNPTTPLATRPYGQVIFPKPQVTNTMNQSKAGANPLKLLVKAGRLEAGIPPLLVTSELLLFMAAAGVALANDRKLSQQY